MRCLERDLSLIIELNNMTAKQEKYTSQERYDPNDGICNNINNVK